MSDPTLPPSPDEFARQVELAFYATTPPNERRRLKRRFRRGGPDAIRHEISAGDLADMDCFAGLDDPDPYIDAAVDGITAALTD